MLLIERIKCRTQHLAFTNSSVRAFILCKMTSGVTCTCLVESGKLGNVTQLDTVKSCEPFPPISARLTKTETANVYIMLYLVVDFVQMAPRAAREKIYRHLTTTRGPLCHSIHKLFHYTEVEMNHQIHVIHKLLLLVFSD